MIEEKPGDPAESQQNNVRKRPAAIIRIFRALKRHNDKQKSRRKPKETDHQKNERLVAESSWLIGKLTVVMVIVSGANVWVVQGQLSEMKSGSAQTDKLIADSTRQADAAEQAERAWVKIDSISASDDLTWDGPPGKPPIIGDFPLNIRLENVGHLPALNIFVSTTTFIPSAGNEDISHVVLRDCPSAKSALPKITYPVDNEEAGSFLFPNWSDPLELIHL